MGSKAKIAEEIIPIMTADRRKDQYFVDLFCGGCNLLDKVDGYRIGNDKNPYLIAMWQYLTTYGDKDLPKIIEKPLYDEYRKLYYNTNKFDDIDGEINEEDLKNVAMCGWIGFMASFNGRFYSGGYSGHNVGKGEKKRDYISEQIRNTLSQVEHLKGVDFSHNNYDDVNIPERSIVYCDPPYKDTKQYEYSKDFDYEKFYEFCYYLKRRGHTVFISEYWMPDGFECIWEKRVTNAMNPTITKKPIEKLYTIL